MLSKFYADGWSFLHGSSQDDLWFYVSLRIAFAPERETYMAFAASSLMKFGLAPVRIEGQNWEWDELLPDPDETFGKSFSMLADDEFLTAVLAMFFCREITASQQRILATHYLSLFEQRLEQLRTKARNSP
jgi:hypothetical protein